MRKACIIGFPVSHSLSPRLHNYWLKQYGIDGEYDAWEVIPEHLASVLPQLKKKGYIGCNLTLPHKEIVLPLLATLDEEASQIGAANTLVVKPDGTLHGKNTDAYGFMENIRTHTSLAKKNRAVVLGAGGAARAVVKALVDEGFGQIVICNRSGEKADNLIRAFTTAGSSNKRLSSVSWEERDEALRHADLLVNATSLGMKGKEPLLLDMRALPRQAVVNDIVYSPLETPLLKAARERGNTAIDGLGMLLWQAVPAFEAWFGVRPEVTKELRDSLL